MGTSIGQAMDGLLHLHPSAGITTKLTLFQDPARSNEKPSMLSAKSFGVFSAVQVPKSII
jgi:hypothetical protein